jgi:hypothetical protein
MHDSDGILAAPLAHQGARDVALERLPVLNQGYGTEASRDWDGEWFDALVMGMLPSDRRR